MSEDCIKLQKRNKVGKRILLESIAKNDIKSNYFHVIIGKIYENQWEINL